MTAGKGRVVLVTGANSGLGLATVLHLARLGFRSVGSVRSEVKATVVTDAASQAGLSVGTVLLDVTDEQQCADVMDSLKPWGVVNNAGYSGVGAIEDITDEEVRRQLETMVVAPMRLARLALPYMRNAGAGRILNISSIYGRTTTPFSGWYQACKHALEAASDALRLEVARDGIKVVLIEPSGFKTGIWADLDQHAEQHTGSAYQHGYSRARTIVHLFTPFMGEPVHVAKAVGRALTAGSPRPRYLVGADAQVIAAAQPFLPTTLRDRITRVVAGL